MTYDGPLRSGAAPVPEDWVVAGPDFAGISPEQAARIADAIMEDERLTGRGAKHEATPLHSTGRSGVPQGYGKWGDLA